MWCAVVVSTKWVDHSGMTNAHFSHCMCLTLWLLSANHGNSGLFSAVLNLATTVVKGYFVDFKFVGNLLFAVNGAGARFVYWPDLNLVTKLEKLHHTCNQQDKIVQTYNFQSNLVVINCLSISHLPFNGYCYNVYRGGEKETPHQELGIPHGTFYFS